MYDQNIKNILKILLLNNSKFFSLTKKTEKNIKIKNNINSAISGPAIKPKGNIPIKYIDIFFNIELN